MSGRTTPWGRAVTDALADGEWHVLEDVIAAGVRVVPPGPAYRQGQRRRTERPGAPAERCKGDGATAVGTGARRLVVNLIGERVLRGAIERAGAMVRRVG